MESKEVEVDIIVDALEDKDVKLGARSISPESFDSDDRH
jgi:hypothetical protein